MIGASHDTLAGWRVIVDEKQVLAEQMRLPREVAGSVTGALARSNIVTGRRHFVDALKAGGAR